MERNDNPQLRRKLERKVSLDTMPDFAGNSPLLLMEGCMYGICSGSLIGAISFWLCHAVLGNPVSAPILSSSILALCFGAFSGAFIGTLFGTSLAYFVNSKKVRNFEESLQIPFDHGLYPDEIQDNFDYIQQWKYQRGEYSKI
ncbi:hypothetical protein H8K32_14810 [Undibacterium jejuense]|uniref:Uncharacterized protein n=1 Tax=Undibacterium jejuense TaxID=1344949 RepID=A0A923HJ52_9BURK|nr:hypothetical protein [Undibacterium jejuense]MBC3863373.1 hypothetical protein [Undibacterium jejuense]